MSLEPFRRTRMVILTRQSKIYQAARAMADNQIGSVLVSGPNGLRESSLTATWRSPSSGAVSTPGRRRSAR